MKKLIIFILSMVFISCSALENFVSNSADNERLIKKYGINNSSVVNYEQTISNIVINESYMEDWYDGDPINYLRANGKINDKDILFFRRIGNKQDKDITTEDYNYFVNRLNVYLRFLSRKFVLESHNIKDPKGLVTFMVSEAKKDYNNPSK